MKKGILSRVKGTWVGPYYVAAQPDKGCGNKLHSGSTGPVVVKSLERYLYSVIDVFRL